MDEYSEKIDRKLFPIIENINKPMILELGVQGGISTKKFLNICDKNNGFLYSVDIEDCSEVSKEKNWKFIHSRDDNFEYIKSEISKNLDVIYIDSLHEAEHVEKIIYGYYDLLNLGGYIFIDDISHLPYLKNKKRNSFYCEINNKETFDSILKIYSINNSNFDLYFSFKSSGLAIIKKISNNTLNKSKKLKIREFSIKNLIRKIWKNLKIG